jgi:hypothetical protein
MHTSGSIVGVPGAGIVIITTFRAIVALSFIAVVEGGDVFIIAILIVGTRIVIVTFLKMSGQNSLIHRLRCAVISVTDNNGLIHASSTSAEIESALISITAIPGRVNAGCAVVAINGAGVAIITDYPGRYIQSIAIRFVAGGILFIIANICLFVVANI